MKKNLHKIAANILYKTFFTTNFAENTNKFYNFVENNYLWKNYLLIKIFRKKNSRKKKFLTNYFNKFTKKVICNIKNFIGIWAYFLIPHCTPDEYNFILYFQENKLQ